MLRCAKPQLVQSPGAGAAVQELLCLCKCAPQSQRLERNQQPLSQLPVSRARLCKYGCVHSLTE